MRSMDKLKIVLLILCFLGSMLCGCTREESIILTTEDDIADYDFEAGSIGYYDLTINYNNEDSENKTVSLFVNGLFFAKIIFEPTDMQGSSVTRTIWFNAGSNVLSFRTLEGDDAVSIQGFEVIQSEHSISLVIAPHEDDEILAFAGSILNAKRAGDTVKIVFLTNGDYFARELAETRIAESVKALAHLGVTEEDIILLGYGDAQIAELFLDDGSGTEYVSHCGMTRTYGNPDLNLYDYHTLNKGESALYTGDNFKKDLSDVLQVFMPQRIYVTSEYEWHPDHKYACRAVVGIAGDMANHPVICESVIHGEESTWPERLRYDASGEVIADCFTYPFPSGDVPYDWNEVERIELDDDMMSLKIAAIDEFVTQNEGTAYHDGNSEFNYAFVKADEFYWIKKY